MLFCFHCFSVKLRNKVLILIYPYPEVKIVAKHRLKVSYKIIFMQFQCYIDDAAVTVSEEGDVKMSVNTSANVDPESTISVTSTNQKDSDLGYITFYKFSVPYYMMTLHAAIIVTGGSPRSSVWTTVELLHSDGSPWCKLPNLPEYRYGHTQTGLEACGGDGSSGTRTTCVRFSGGSWSPSHQLVQLTQGRRAHSSWASPAGTLIIGGRYSKKSTELLDTNTGDSVMSFPLKDDTK